MTHENAMRWYSFDPFTHIPKEEATVGALRARAAGHDVSTMSRSTRVRTPDEKLEGFRSRARRAVAARRDLNRLEQWTARGARRCRVLRPTSCARSQSPRAAPASRTWDSAIVRAVDGVTTADGVEEGGVLGPAPALLLREELEVALGTTRTAWRR